MTTDKTATLNLDLALDTALKANAAERERLLQAAEALNGRKTILPPGNHTGTVEDVKIHDDHVTATLRVKRDGSQEVVDVKQTLGRRKGSRTGKLSVADKMLQLLKRGNEAPIGSIAKALKISPTHASATVAKLVKSKLAKKTGRGTYAPTAKAGK